MRTGNAASNSALLITWQSRSIWNTSFAACGPRSVDAMERLTRRVRRGYAGAISLALAGITVCLGFIVFAVQVRTLDSRSHVALDDYARRAQRAGPITTEPQFERLIAGTSY